MKKIAIAIVLLAMSLSAMSQSGTNSPYSQYGFGQMADQSTGFNRGMNGVGQGFREHNQVNFINPASYSAVDSLTFIFDAGVSGQVTNFSENGKRKNARNADFDYAVALFRACKHVGVSFGVVPFTNVGYKYTSVGYLNADNTSSYQNTYSGSGGFHQAYLGAGWEPVRNLSVGANVSYLWGEYTRTISNVYGDGSVNTLYKYYLATVNNYKVDFAAQYTLPLGKNDRLTLGVTYSPGHAVHSAPECQVISYNATTAVGDTASYSVKNGLELPHMWGAGLTYVHKNQLKIGADYSLQEWGKTSFPVYEVVNEHPSYVLSDKCFKSRHKVAVGGEYCRGENARSFLKRLRYRAGFSYSTPYMKINGSDGPKEVSVSAGFGIPIVNMYNNRSLLNISGQWSRLGGNGLLTENTFRINIGMTFNERWFMKWKVN